MEKVRPEAAEVKFEEIKSTRFESEEDIIMPVVKFDADSASAITYMTENSNLNYNPSSVNTVNSSQLQHELTFLARQLEMEKQRREKLQTEVESMAGRLRDIEEDGRKEAEKNEILRRQREKNVKPPNMDVANLKVLNHGFVSIQ